MGLLRQNGRNISVASCNGYTVEKVIKAKQYLKEIGSNRRGFDVNRLVEMYNDIKGTKEKAAGCKPCAATKYYNGIQNYAYFGELTLINNGKCTKEDLDLDLIDRAAMSGFTSVEDYQNEVEAIKDEIEEALHDSELDGEEAFPEVEEGGIITVTPEGELKPEKEDIKERMAKVRACRKNNKKKDD